MKKNDDPLLKRKEAADYINSTYGTLSTWHSTKAHDLKPIKKGRYIRYRKSVLDKWLAGTLEK